MPKIVSADLKAKPRPQNLPMTGFGDYIAT